MSQARRVLWGEGMFLRPQHFQQQDLYLDGRLAHCLTTVQPHPWGLCSLAVDQDALKSGLLRVDQLDLLFQDGTLIRAPQEEPLPLVRNIQEIPNLGVETIIHACLPSLNAFGGNCVVTDRPEGHPVRFHSDRIQVADLYTRALESEVTVLRTNLRLMADVENRDGHFCVPILRLVKNAVGEWTVDHDYVPPSMEIRAAGALSILIRRILDILQVKSQTLTATHRERAHSVVEFGISDVSTFWLLHTVNRNFPLLNHFMRFPQLHPERLYLALAQMAAELLTFSSTLTLVDIPLYDHSDLTGTFGRLDDMIRTLLDTVISNRYVSIPLEEIRPSFFTGRLDYDYMQEKSDFYLSISSEHPATSIIESIPYKLKIGSPDDVEKILNSALPGVRLIHVTQTPAAIPVRIGNHYFALEKQSTIFENMLKSGSVCIYKPQSLPAMKLELFAVFR